MEKEASLDKMILAKKTCLNILKDNSIPIVQLRKMVSYILDAIDLVGEDRPFTKPQEDLLIKELKEELIKQGRMKTNRFNNDK